MSTRVRCSLNYGGSRYATTRQAVSVAVGIYRQNTGRYYLVKKGTTPLWKYLVEMVEKTPDWPEGAKLKVWREKRGSGRERKTAEVMPQRAPATTLRPGGIQFVPAPEPRGRFFRNGLFVANTGRQEVAGREVPRAER